MSYLKLENISKTYNKGKNYEVEALKDVNISIEKGDLCAIVGPSGSGKSTLLYLLGCLDKAEIGKYIINSKEISSFNSKERAEFRNKEVGFVLQDFGLIEDESVYENIRVPLLFTKYKWKQINRMIKEILDILEITNLKDKKVSNLSGGQRQRVAIARAIVNNPKMILADEPTGSLDSANSQMIVNLLIQLNKEGKTVIIVTHNMEIAQKCKRIFYIKDGRVLETI